MAFPEGVDCFVIASDEDSGDWRLDVALEVGLEGAELFVLLGAVHVVEVLLVADGLEVSADDEEVEGELYFALECG